MSPVAAAPGAAAARSAVRADAARAYAHHRGARSRFEAELLAALTCSQFPFLLNRMDKDAMAASVETRVPFLDPVVAALALNFPLERRTAPRIKGVLRDVARRHLPAPIAHRPKQPGLTFAGARRIEEAARPGFLRDGVVRDVLRLSDAAMEDVRVGLGPRRGIRLWTAEIWARLFLEGHGVERVEGELWA